MKRLLCFFTMLFPVGLSAQDCRCSRTIPSFSILEVFEADLVFQGHVIDLKVSDSLDAPSAYLHHADGEVFLPIATFVVSEVYKGAAGDTMEIRFDASGSRFLHLFKGHEYIVFAHQDAQGDFYTEPCDRTTPADSMRETASYEDYLALADPKQYRKWNRRWNKPSMKSKHAQAFKAHREEWHKNELHQMKLLLSVIQDTAGPAKWDIMTGSRTPDASGTLNGGKPTGHWTFYYPNGHPWQEGNFDDRGNRTGKWTIHHLDPSVNRKPTYRTEQVIFDSAR